MGNKISVVHGVKSDHFYDQGNAINEIWVGDVEIVSRLPFGDSDQEQAGWPVGGVPKIPWHQFIIPLHKRDEAGNTSTGNMFSDRSFQQCTCEGWLPTNGYLGMYTSIDWAAAEVVGMIMFFLAGISMMEYFTMHSKAYTRLRTSFLLSKRLSEELSEHGVDETQIKRQAVYDFRISLLRAAMFMVLAVLLVVLGVPAYAAAAQKQNAAVWILVHAFLASIGGFVSLILFDTYLMVRGKPWTEKQLQEILSLYNSDGVEAEPVGNGTKGPP
jgi:hypothetical protein